MEGNESATRKDAIDLALLQWAKERPDLDASPIAVFGRLSRVYLVAQARLRTLLAAYELTPATFDVLANLRRSGPPHRKSAGDIAASSLLSTGGTSFRLDRLEERRLVQRVTGTHDRRVIYVELTTQGCELIDVVMAAHLEQEARMLAGLSAEERAALSLLLRGLERSIGEDLSE